VFAIDGFSDSVLTVFPARSGWGGTLIALNRNRNCVYALNSYQSSVLVIADTSVVGLQDGIVGVGLPSRRPQTVIRGVLYLNERPRSGPRTICLLDISGRKVLDLKPGANDVWALAPGVYFVREQGSRGRGFQDSRVTKVVVTR